MKLVFVYNADSGLANGIMDSIHKTLSPQTYECALCQITYGLVSMDKSWRDYLKSLPIEAEFFHRKDFRVAYPSANVDLPVILLEQEGALTPLVTAQAMAGISDVNSLTNALNLALAHLKLQTN
jgi:hypothetical protein